jgi:hypothetical protein
MSWLDGLRDRLHWLFRSTDAEDSLDSELQSRGSRTWAVISPMRPADFAGVRDSRSRSWPRSRSGSGPTPRCSAWWTESPCVP